MSCDANRYRQFAGQAKGNQLSTFPMRMQRLAERYTPWGGCYRAFRAVCGPADAKQVMTEAHRRGNETRTARIWPTACQRPCIAPRGPAEARASACHQGRAASRAGQNPVTRVRRPAACADPRPSLPWDPLPMFVCWQQSAALLQLRNLARSGCCTAPPAHTSCKHDGRPNVDPRP